MLQTVKMNYIYPKTTEYLIMQLLLNIYECTNLKIMFFLKAENPELNLCCLMKPDKPKMNIGRKQMNVRKKLNLCNYY
jgi:hypothetical protein